MSNFSKNDNFLIPNWDYVFKTISVNEIINYCQFQDVFETKIRHFVPTKIEKNQRIGHFER